VRNTDKTRKKLYLSYIFITLSVIFWGYSFISTKELLKVLPPISIAFFRQIIASTTLIVWLLITKSFSKITYKHFFVIAISGFFGIVLYFVFENTGLMYTSASNASMIVAAVPIFTLLSEVLFYKLKINVKMIFCIVLSIIGVYLVITVTGKLDFSSSMFKGNLLMLGAMIAWVIYTIINKGLSTKYSSLLMTAYQSIISIFIFIPFIIPEAGSWKKLTLVPLLNLLYLGVFCSAFAYFFYNYAVKRIGPTISSAFLNLIPVVSVFFACLILGESLYLIQIAGMILIMLSLYLLSRKQKI
jgi:drug/metabolite transporter (DMT)-like permease